MPGFTKSSQAGYYRFLFGDGSDGDLTVSADTYLSSSLNGDIVYKNYRDLTINSGKLLSVTNMCKGLWIRVRGTLTLNGTISMSGKGGYYPGAANLYVCYNDILIPATDGAYGASPAVGNINGNSGGNASNGGCGGGGSGGSAQKTTERQQQGARGSAGYSGGGGRGGGGGAAATDGGWYQINSGQTLPVIGGDYGANNGVGGYYYVNGSKDDIWRTCNGTGGSAQGGGGILIIMANSFSGSGSIISNGDIGLNASVGGSEWGYATAAGGGGSGAGSIILFYGTMSGTPSFQANGGAGGVGANYGKSGGAGGAGSCRQWSLQQLLSHTRI